MPAIVVNELPPEKIDRYTIPNEEWWLHPVIYAVEGVRYRFYAMRHVAAALHRAPGTIRRWEREGAIPQPQYEKRGATVQGNRRLYTRRQIQAMVDAAREVGMIPDSDFHPTPEQIVAFGAIIQSRWKNTGMLHERDIVHTKRFEDE